MTDSNHIFENGLADLAQGTLSAEESARLERHLSQCAECRAFARQYASSLEDALNEGDVAAIVDGAWSRLARRIEGTGRFDHLAAELAAWLDLPEAEVLALLRTVDDEDAYVAECAPGVRARPVQVGPARSMCSALLVRAAPGAIVPEHTHEPGAEHTFVIQGGYTSSDGSTDVIRGQRMTYAPGTSHSVTAMPGVICLCFLLNENS